MLATSFALVLGTIIGLVAAYNRGKLDDVLMRTMDVILAFPQIILALLVISMFGATNTLIILTVGVSTVPRIARVVRGSAVSVVERDFVCRRRGTRRITLAHPSIRVAARTFRRRCSSRPTCGSRSRSA